MSRGGRRLWGSPGFNFVRPGSPEGSGGDGESEEGAGEPGEVAMEVEGACLLFVGMVSVLTHRFVFSMTTYTA